MGCTRAIGIINIVNLYITGLTEYTMECFLGYSIALYVDTIYGDSQISNVYIDSISSWNPAIILSNFILRLLLLSVQIEQSLVSGTVIFFKKIMSLKIIDLTILEIYEIKTILTITDSPAV